MNISNLKGLYEALCNYPSDINEHLPVLCEYAKECSHITEFGTRAGISTTAFMYAKPNTLITYDIKKYPEVDRLQSFSDGVDFKFIHKSVLDVEIEETDILFIDTIHNYPHLKKELELHADKVRELIIIHDTEINSVVGTYGYEGVRRAIIEFLMKGHFMVEKHFKNNNGLTVLRRWKT